jgi:hypothetical protein
MTVGREATVNIRLTLKQKRRLERLAAARDVSISEYLRRHIDWTFVAEFKKREEMAGRNE